MTPKILIIGASGQIGSELTLQLRIRFGSDNVIASDINEGNLELMASGPFEILDAKNYDAIKTCVEKYNIKTVYLMAAMLSAKGEQFPALAWDLNMTSLFNVLDLAKEKIIDKIFWPSSIAVFGPSTPRSHTPQSTVMEPTTVYGISKLTGERWCEYYFRNYGVDVRSVRYPGIISWKTKPGGGTTDYAIEIFHEAVNNQHYDCFLLEDTALPMMYMDDAVRATIDLMEADSQRVKVRSSYNLSAISFSPRELTVAIQKQMPDFTIAYTPDFRQQIAETWPNSIDDTAARNDWNWEHHYDLDTITKEMLLHIGNKEIAG